ncbi:MAG: DUF692 domain-containing protein [Polyangiaceae bacterium]|nr:DUF692 domain-containing protein [Polyangiaceae bacterium]
MTSRLGLPDLGVGVGLRVPHYRHILDSRPAVDFFEVISENFMVPGGKPRYHLSAVCETYPVVQHGVSLGIGNPTAPADDYLDALRKLVDETKTPWVSDHLCWTGVPGTNLHDLLPLPYTQEVVKRVSERAKRVQDRLGVRLLLENTSSYMSHASSTMPEWEFVSAIAEAADIGLLFDVNNVYVSAYNHGFDPSEFVRSVPHERIVQIHLAGHDNLGRYIIDTHGGHVIDPVWELYRETIERTGPVSTLIEWDDRIPEFPVLAAEAERARRVRAEAVAARAALGGRAPARPRMGVPVRGAAVPQHRAWTQGGPREHEGGSP